MAWSIFLSALGLVFVLEGILPFMAPAFWRGAMQQMSSLSDRSLRIIGLVSMLLGVTLVCVAHDLFPRII